MILAPRQTGKSTAVAVRVLHEAMSHDDAVILLASASGRQSGQIMEKARKMAKSLNLEILPPPNKCDGFRLANGSEIIALPDNEETIRGFSAPRLIVVDEAAFASEDVFKALEPMLTVSNGTFILLSTPNGQSGYFYEQWHAENGPWKKLQGSLERCPRVNQEAIENIRKTTAKDTSPRNSNVSSSPPAARSSVWKPSASATPTTSISSIPNTISKEKSNGTTRRQNIRVHLVYPHSL